MLKTNVYRLPSSWEARELLREKGQFWTSDWIAELMVEYVLADKGGLLFDPAVGAGAFFRAAKGVASEKGLSVSFAGLEIDPTILSQALEHGLDPDDIASVRIGDFLLQPPETKLQAIVANPPYIRHHRLDPERKAQLKELAVQLVGRQLDGRPGLHVYFLIRALSLLQENGRLAFIMPADTCEGKFVQNLPHLGVRRRRLDPERSSPGFGSSPAETAAGGMLHHGKPAHQRVVQPVIRQVLCPPVRDLGEAV